MPSLYIAKRARCIHKSGCFWSHAIHLYRALWKIHSAVRNDRSLLQKSPIKETLFFIGLSHAMHLYRALKEIYSAVRERLCCSYPMPRQTYRALLQIYRARLRKCTWLLIYMALSQIYRALLRKHTGLFCRSTGRVCKYTGLFCRYTGLFCGNVGHC